MAEVDHGGLEDIEDLVHDEDDGPVQRLERPENELLPAARNRRRDESVEAQEVPHDSNIPGVQSIYVKTWGCAHNNSDGEYMAGQLAAYGYTVTDDEKQADKAHLWLLNSCTVKVCISFQTNFSLILTKFCCRILRKTTL